MTLDELFAEMQKRGCNTSNLKSKAWGIALDILQGGDDTVFLDIVSAHKKLDELRAQISCDKFNHEQELRDYERAKKQAIDIQNSVKEYVEAFNKSLLDAETPEARDRLRIAQMFVNSVDIDTKYDNTAFIIGLSEILAGKECASISALQKINPKLTDLRKTY